VYCEGDYHETNDKSHPALLLCNFLRRCGIDCVVDLHHSSESINNWSLWVEQNVQNCNGYIILLCGKILYESLQNSENRRIKMNVAHIGKLTLNYLIDDSKTNTYFVPVFIGEPLVDYIPTALKNRCYYTVQYDAVVDPDDVSIILTKRENRSLRSLVAKLTRYDMPPIHITFNSDSSEDLFSLQEYFVIGMFLV